MNVIVRDRLLYIISTALLVVTSFLLGTHRADAQVRNRVDHRGKEFRLAFLHTNGEGQFPTFHIVVGCEKVTTGTITYESTGRTVNVTIPVPNRPERITLDTFPLLLPDPTKDVEISSQTLTLRFNDEVTLYGINTLRWSSDGFLGLPLEVIGRDYMIMSYPNTVEPSAAGQVLNVSDFPSQFAVVGTQDGTTITVNPTTPVNGRENTNPFQIRLNAGQVFFAQARESDRYPPVAGRDLTGTRLTSDKPIVVMGSHQRANIPWNEAVGRDHLVEQLPSTDRWTRRAMVTPHFQLEKTLPDDNFVRVIASQGGTILTIDSGASQPLPVGRAVEIPLKRPMLLTANNPILVAQFQHSTTDVEYISVANDTVGDPFMMLVPSREQFDSSYTFESWDTKDFFYHFINVVIPTERISTLRLDGGPITNATFSRIDKTSYSYAQIPVLAGPHHISARVPFGLYMYGYGPYNSYGYPGGMVFDSIFKDHKEPDIAWRDTCGGVVGAAFDTAAFDFGMEDLRLQPGSGNVQLFTEPFQRGDDSIRFRLNLLDPFQDGLAHLIAVDTAGLDRRYNFPVKGFTVSMASSQSQVVLDTLASLNGLEFCLEISLRNYGAFPQRINELTFSKPVQGLRVQGSFPLTLQPGETRVVTVCFQRTGDMTDVVELGLDNGCLIRKIATLPLLSGIDSLKPVISKLSTECDKDIIFEITEQYALNSGIKQVTIHSKKNAEINIPLPQSLPGRLARIEIRRKSIWEDVIYDIEIVDVVGNSVRLYDTIGGLTLAISDQPTTQEFGFRLDPSVPWQYETLVYSEQDCDTLWLQNTGLRTLDLYRLRLSGNLDFSIPPEQLPLRLDPGERRPVVVCVRPIGIGEFRDTLIIEFFCGSLTEIVEFKSVVDPLSGSGQDRCGNPMQFNVKGFTKRNFLEPPAPNPVHKGNAVLTLGLTGPQKVTLLLRDAMGNEVRRFLDGDALPGGIGQIQADLNDLPSGQYYLQMRTSSGDAAVQPLVIRQ